MTTQTFQLGPWMVEVQRGSVIGPDGNEHHLEPKVMEVLACLAEHANEVVSRQDLLDAVWGGSSGSDEQLTRAIGEIRRSFEDDPVNPRFVETVPKRGYCLIGGIHPIDKQSADGRLVARSIRQPGLGPIAAGIAVVGMLTLVLVASRTYFFESVPDAIITDDQSIAVLPFVNMSDDPANEYFADGITEEILNLLTRVPNLRVIGRTSSFSFKGQNVDLREIGQTLGVTTILEGSIRKIGDRVRIVAQLNDAMDGSHIWSESYDRTLTDIFAVQEEVAAAVISAMQVHVANTPDRGRPTDNWEAFSSFLKARIATSRLEWRDASNLLTKAIELDANFAEAHELLSLCYWHMGTWFLDQQVAQQKAYNAAAMAVSMDPDLLFAQTIYRSGNAGSSSPVKTFAALDWAFRQNPNNPYVLDRLIWNLIFAGYLDEAVRVARRYVRIDPLSLDANLDLFGALYGTGRTDEAIRVLSLVEEIGLHPNNWLWTIGGIDIVEGRDEKAIDNFQSLLRLYGFTDLDWITDLVTVAREPDAGQARLDQQIPIIVETLGKLDQFNLRLGMTDWYLFFGFIDRYYEWLLAANPRDDVWTEIEEQVWHGHVLRRLGFTAHPDYLRLATDLGIVDVWEKRGPPDFCRKIEGSWLCE